jgi:hypothetical protein
MDGTGKIHDSIRGEWSSALTKKNILDYISGPAEQRRSRKQAAWRKQIWIGMTINSLNYTAVKDLAEEWRGKINKIRFQFHTPFVKGDPL